MEVFYAYILHCSYNNDSSGDCMKNLIIMTIAFVFLLIVMSMYSISNQAYGNHINSVFEVKEEL